MPKVDDRKILQDQPWEGASFFSPPVGDDKWITTSDRRWIYRTHKKPRKKGFHPIHRSFPLQDVSCLSLQRITVAFPEPKAMPKTATTSMDRLIFIDQFSDVKPEVESLDTRWRGYTFFRILDSTDGGEKPNDQSVASASDQRMLWESSLCQLASYVLAVGGLAMAKSSRKKDNKEKKRKGKKRKAKSLQLGKACSRISDLKVEQLAIILTVHDLLTSQSLFSLGGELLEVHRRALSLQKRQEDGTHRGLEMRVEVSKRMGWSIMNEVEVHVKSSEAATWLSTLKKLIVDAKAVAADDMQKDQTETRRTTSPERKSKSKKVKRDRKKKSRSRSSSANRSDSEEARFQPNWF
eukprot:s1312_g17.t1